MNYRYAFHNNFSGTTLYDPYLYQFFNLFYTSVPIMIYALFDSEYPDRIFETNFLLYKLGQQSNYCSVAAKS